MYLEELRKLLAFLKSSKLTTLSVDAEELQEAYNQLNHAEKLDLSDFLSVFEDIDF